MAEKSPGRDPQPFDAPVVEVTVLEAAERAYVLRSGEVVAEGTGAELREREDLFDTFVGGAGS